MEPAQDDFEQLHDFLIPCHNARHMATAAAPKTSGFPWFKTIRWTVLAVLIIAVMLMVKKPVPPATFSQVTPEAAAASATSFDTKLNELERARQGGYAAEVRLSTDELNSAFQRSQGQAPQTPTTLTDNPAPETPSSPEGPPQVKSMQFAMVGDQVLGQFVVQRYGVDIYVTLAGKLNSKDGYVGLKPTLFKVGDLNVPISWVDSTLQSKLADPENREKLKLPQFVSDIRVENGELVIVEK
jgi:uncharacterized protein YpmS